MAAQRQLNQRLLPQAVFWMILFLQGTQWPATAYPTIVPDAGHKQVIISSDDGQLVLRLNYGDGCRLDQIKVRGRDAADGSGVFTGVRMGEEWFTSRSASEVRIEPGKNTVTLTGIHFGKPGQRVSETWTFTTHSDRILWKIKRRYAAEAIMDDIAIPEWNFGNMSTWTGGLLDNGGVVWNKYLDRPNATYGGHFGTVTFGNARSNDCLRITPVLPKNSFGAGRFSRQPTGVFSFCYSISDERSNPAHGQSRYMRDRQDLWKPFKIHPTEVTAEFALQALEYDKASDRGHFVGVDGRIVSELFNTVARYGVIDSQLVGGNGWRSGFLCLHEPFFGQMAAAVDSSDYTGNLAAALDFARDHAISTNGRVKSRWSYGPGDDMRGTYDEFGFYEAQWGYLMDSQPDYVVNVVEEFFVTGDLAWLARHRDSCERALEFLTRREVGNSGLVAMPTDSHKENRGSDWIDIIWAAYENALINAEFYAALGLWADAEIALGDSSKAANCCAFAARLKATFNRPISEGGFWDPTNQWYVYWRDKDGSIHGNNLVTPVNFAAIAYGICDDPARQKAILDRIEAEMTKENLFYWPLSFFPYDREEGEAGNFPFPRYENGDIFLSWGELAVRAYAAYDSGLALKYVKNTLARYAEDGLSFQRYLRKSQRGEGDDILAGNCMPIVGLYRDIYGLQPKPNRLYLEPHLTPELSGTKLRYNLRGQSYQINLCSDGVSSSAGKCTLRAPQPFGVCATRTGMQYFPGGQPDWALSVSAPEGVELSLHIEHWPGAADGSREWSESASRGGGKISHVIKGLTPNAGYELDMDGRPAGSFRADKQGQVEFSSRIVSSGSHRLKISMTN